MLPFFQDWITSLEIITPEHHQGSGSGSHYGNSYKVQHFTFMLKPFYRVLEIERENKGDANALERPFLHQTFSVSKILANKIFR